MDQLALKVNQGIGSGPVNSARTAEQLFATHKVEVRKPMYDAALKLPAFLIESGVAGQVLSLHKRHHIFSQGSDSDAAFYIIEGQVKLSAVSEGKESTIALLGPGDFFGEECIASRRPARLGTAVSTTECRIFMISAKTIEESLRKEARFLDCFLDFVLKRNLRMQEDLIAHLSHSSEKRLARVLLLLADFDSPEQTARVIPKISQETLAEMVGTTRSRVSFFMNRFRKQGLIDYGSGLEIRRSLESVITDQNK